MIREYSPGLFHLNQTYCDEFSQPIKKYCCGTGIYIKSIAPEIVNKKGKVNNLPFVTFL